MKEERLQKIISQLGLGSRRQAEAWIEEGLVKVNGKVANLGDRAVLGQDSIKLKNKLISNQKKEKQVVVILYKPKGYICGQIHELDESNPNKGSIYQLIPKIKERVFPISRLDSDAEGVLLLSNNGELSQRLSQKKFEVNKRYALKIDGHLSSKDLQRLQKGIRIEGRNIQNLNVKTRSLLDGKSWIQVETTESQNRIIRKVFEHIGRPVDKLRREVFADLTLKGMVRGQYRYLSEEEVEGLKKWVGLNESY